MNAATGERFFAFEYNLIKIHLKDKKPSPVRVFTDSGEFCLNSSFLVMSLEL